LGEESEKTTTNATNDESPFQSNQTPSFPERERTDNRDALTGVVAKKSRIGFVVCSPNLALVFLGGVGWCATLSLSYLVLLIISLISSLHALPA
jgi:hypothetical protein